MQLIIKKNNILLHDRPLQSLYNKYLQFKNTNLLVNTNFVSNSVYIRFFNENSFDLFRSNNLRDNNKEDVGSLSIYGQGKIVVESSVSLRAITSITGTNWMLLLTNV